MVRPVPAALPPVALPPAVRLPAGLPAVGGVARAALGEAEEEPPPRVAHEAPDGVDDARPRMRGQAPLLPLAGVPADIYGDPPPPIDLAPVWGHMVDVDTARPPGLDVLSGILARARRTAGSLCPDPARPNAWLPLAEALGVGALPVWLVAAHNDRGIALPQLTAIVARLALTPQDAAAVVDAARALFDRELLLAAHDGLVQNRSLPEAERIRQLAAALKIDEPPPAHAAPGAFALRQPSILELHRVGPAHADPAVRVIFARAMADPAGVFARLAPPFRREAADALCTDGDFTVRKAASPLFWQTSPQVHQRNHDAIARAPGTWADGEHLRALLESAPPDTNPYVLVHLIGSVNTSVARCAAAGRAMLRSTTMPFEQRHQYMLYIAAHSSAAEVRDCVAEHLALAPEIAVLGAARDKILDEPVLAMLLLGEEAAPHRVGLAALARARELRAVEPEAHRTLAERWPPQDGEAAALAQVARLVLSASSPIPGNTLSRREATLLLLRTGAVGTAELVDAARRAMEEAPSVRGLADRLAAIDVLCARPELEPSALHQLVKIALCALVTPAAVTELGLDEAAVAPSSPLPRAVFERLVARLGDPRLTRQDVIAILDAVLDAARAGGNSRDLRPFLDCAAQLGLDPGILLTLSERAGAFWGPAQVAPLEMPPDGLRAAALQLAPDTLFRRYALGYRVVRERPSWAEGAIERAGGALLETQSALLERMQANDATRPIALFAAIDGIAPTRNFTRAGMQALVALLTRANLSTDDATSVLTRLLGRTLPVVGGETSSHKLVGTRMALAVVEQVLQARADFSADDRLLLERASAAVLDCVRIEADVEPARQRGLATLHQAMANQRLLRPIAWKRGAPNLPLHPDPIDLGHGLRMAYVNPVVPNAVDAGVAPFDRAQGEVVFLDDVRGGFAGRFPLAPVGARPPRRGAELLWAAAERLPHQPAAYLERALPDEPVPVLLASGPMHELQSVPAWWPVPADRVVHPVPARVNVRAIEELAVALPELREMKLELTRVDKTVVHSKLRVRSTGRLLTLPAALGKLVLELDRGDGAVENVDPARNSEHGFYPNGLKLKLVWKQKAGDDEIRRELVAMDAPNGGLHFDLATLAQTTRSLLALDALAQEQG